MASLTVQVAAANEDGYIVFQDDQTGFMGDSTGFTTNARVKVGQHTGQNLGDSSTHDTYTGWVHLKNITIDQGATISSAKLHFYHHANNGFDAGDDPSEGFTVAAQDADNATRPSTYGHVDGWILTSATVNTGSLIDASSGMMGPNESFNNAWYPTHASAGTGLEIKTIIQELVDRSGWSSGNNINLKLTPASHDGSTDWDIEWKDYDTSSSLAIKLVITYSAAAAATANPAFLLFLDI